MRELEREQDSMCEQGRRTNRHGMMAVRGAVGSVGFNVRVREKMDYLRSLSADGWVGRAG
jgi:hypothetical protein